MEIYSSKFKKTVYNENESLICNYWTDADMADEDFVHEIAVWAEQVEKYRPTNLLADTRKFNFTVSVQLQEWTDKEVFPRLMNSGVKNSQFL